ncbi:MAG: TlpA family protein disulfide reductase [Acidobacteria bacterium]|nr:TlpA family protein disulfide reductase [Acidobacteriota bacterium]
MTKLLKTRLTVTMILLAAVAGSAVAQQAPQFSLRSTEGRTVNSSELRGKIVVLSFGSTTVPLTAKELVALQKQADRYSPRGVQFFWVSVNSDKAGARAYASDADLQAFAQKVSLRIPVLRDPEQQTYKAFGLDGLPTVVIISDGKIALKHVGFGTDQGEGYPEVAKVLDQLLK